MGELEIKDAKQFEYLWKANGDLGNGARMKLEDALSVPNFLTRWWASDSAPPEASRICPKMAPSPTTTATNPSVPPIPS